MTLTGNPSIMHYKYGRKMIKHEGDEVDCYVFFAVPYTPREFDLDIEGVMTLKMELEKMMDEIVRKGAEEFGHAVGIGGEVQEYMLDYLLVHNPMFEFRYFGGI